MTAPVVIMDEAALRAIVADELARQLAPVKAALAAVAPAARHDDLLDAEQLAARLLVTARTLRRLVLERAVPAPMMIAGRIPRWRRIDVDRWLESGCQVDPALSIPARRGSMSPVRKTP